MILDSHFLVIDKDSITKINYWCFKFASAEKKHICYENGNTAADFVSKPEDPYRRIYYEALDLIIESITDHFNQPGYELYSTYIE